MLAGGGEGVEDKCLCIALMSKEAIKIAPTIKRTSATLSPLTHATKNISVLDLNHMKSPFGPILQRQCHQL